MKALSKSLAGLLLLAAIPNAARSQDIKIDVHSVATIGSKEVILDLIADTKETAVRGFGLRVRYKPGDLELVSAGTYGGLWFLQDEKGRAAPYTDVTLPGGGDVRMVGGRFDGTDPGEGIRGSSLLLGTLVFKRLNANPPAFSIEPPDPSSFSLFTSVAGENLNDQVRFLETVEQPAAEDKDDDGLPDDYERTTFGDLTTSDGGGDFDGDGDSDGDEFIQGTDPTDPASKSRLQLVLQPDGSKLLRWDGAAGRVYNLRWSTSPATMGSMLRGIPGEPRAYKILDDWHNPDPRGFYQLETLHPTAGR